MRILSKKLSKGKSVWLHVRSCTTNRYWRLNRVNSKTIWTFFRPFVQKRRKNDALMTSFRGFYHLKHFFDLMWRRIDGIFLSGHESVLSRFFFFCKFEWIVLFDYFYYFVKNFIVRLLLDLVNVQVLPNPHFSKSKK